MKFEIGQLIYRILGDNSGIDKSLKDTESKAKKTGLSFKKIIAGIGVAAIGSKLIGFFKSAVSFASDLEESTQKFGVVFSDVFPAASLAARDLAENYGLSTRAAQDALAANGNLFTQLGATQSEALKYGNTLAEVGTDLASFTNFSGGAEGAINALKSAVLGEREALKSLDIPILEQDLKDFAKTVGKNWLEMNKLEKATLSLDLILKRSTNAIGDFERSADSWANVQRRVSASVEDSSARIGNTLLPGLSKLGVAFVEGNKNGGIFEKTMSGIGTGFNFLIEGLAGGLNAYNKINDVMRESTDESFRVEKQIKDTKNQMLEMGVELAKNAGLTGTATEGTKAFQDALKDGDFDARRLSDSVRDLSTDLETLRIQSISISNPLGATALALEDAFNLATKSADRLKKRSTTTEKRQKAAFDRRIARLQAEIDLARFAEEEIKAIGLEGGLAVIQVENDKLITKKQRLALSVALEKKAEDDILDYKIQRANEFASIALGGAVSLFGALSALSQAQTQSRLNDIDLQLARALEVADLTEETAIEKAEAELERAEEDGDADLIREAKDSVKREKILAEFDKKRRQAEYDGAVSVWEFQVAQTVASGILAIQNAIAAGWLFGGPVGAASFGAAATLTSGIQLAAITESKPEPPKFAHGGIIQGSTSGTAIIAGENNRDEGIFNQAQMQRLLSIADGQGGGGGFQRVAPLSKEMFYQELLEATQNGELFYSKDAAI